MYACHVCRVSVHTFLYLFNIFEIRARPSRVGTPQKNLVIARAIKWAVALDFVIRYGSVHFMATLTCSFIRPRMDDDEMNPTH